MEQQNQQPNQEKIESKPPIKTNWKYIAIVAVLGLVVEGGILWYANLPTRTSNIIVSNETPVNNYNDEENRPMYQCIKDNDCMLVKDGYCGIVISINKAYQTAWTEQDKIDSEQARKNRQTCKVADKESLDINNYTSSCYNSGCNVKAPQPTQTDENSNWQTYRNEEFGFEVKYPRDWVIKPYPEYVGYFEGLVRGTTHMIWITSLNNTVRGISYCEAYPDDAPRCERLQAGGIPIIVDWDFLIPDDTLSNEPPGRLASALVGMNNEVSLNIVISDFSFEMNPQTKEFFRTFLSTFRFAPPAR